MDRDVYNGPWDDFPRRPILDGNAVATIPAAFEPEGSPVDGPCLYSPEPGTLIPRNWIRPRFSWVPSPTHNMFELRVSVPNQVNPLVVYTTAASWTMPEDMWNAVRIHSANQPLTVSIRSISWDGSQATAGPFLGTQGDIRIAPVDAPGAIVYWKIKDMVETALRGFRVGDESVQTMVDPRTHGFECVGCHSSTPDGLFAGFVSAPATNGAVGKLQIRSTDGMATVPDFLSPAAQELMQRDFQQAPAFSPLHWAPGDRKVIASYMTPESTWALEWLDLEATHTESGMGWGTIARIGDPQGAVSPTFAHTRDDILYVSTPAPESGVVPLEAGDVMIVPYNNGAGGQAMPVPGASNPDLNEYYPSFSPDDRLIAFNSTPRGVTGYNQAASEVFVIPSEGGVPTRLEANQGASCLGYTSPGLTNSWPKWSPSVIDTDEGTYYWIVFSSRRGPGAGNPQLFITPVIVQDGTIRTYPALHLWNQPVDENNHTPAWDLFQIPLD